MSSNFGDQPGSVLRQSGDTSLIGESLQAVVRQLDEVIKSCAAADWDGHGAVPVNAIAADQATRFLDALPSGVPLPTVSAEPDGQITFEWYRSPRRTLSVSVSPDHELHYAALLDPGKQYGTEPFFDRVPESVLTLIRRINAT